MALIGAAWFVYVFWLERPVGDGPAGAAVDRQLFTQPWSSRKVVLLGMGDSITAGYGASQGKSYFSMLVENPPDELADMEGISLRQVLASLSVYNLAVSGSDSINHVQKQLPELKSFPVDVFGVVALTTGGNDLIHWYGARPPMEGAMYGASMEQAEPWVENFRMRLDDILNGIRKAFPGGCHIFLANIYDPSDGGGDPRWLGLPPWRDAQKILAAYNEVIAESASSHGDVELVDLYSEFMDHGIRCRHFWRDFYDSEDPGYWYYQNIEDPNERGYDAIRRAFLNEMARVLPRRLSGGS